MEKSKLCQVETPINPIHVSPFIIFFTTFQVNKQIDKQLKKDKKKYKSTHRLQLVGPAGSGKSTLITQVSAR